MVNARWREQYEDAVSVYLRMQEVADPGVVARADPARPAEIAADRVQDFEADPGHAWLRRLILAIARDVAPAGLEPPLEPPGA